MTIRNGTIASEMVLSVHQNMTQFPTQITKLDGATDSSLMGNFTKALRNADPSATLSQLTLTISSSANWMNVTASIDISGVTAQSGDITNTTTTWRSYYVDADLRAGNLSFNTVGSRYLRPVYDYYENATRYIGKPNATINGITFLSNDTSIGGDQAANQAGNLTLFDFKPLNVSLNQWDYKYNLENNTTTWRYSPAPIITSSIKVTKGLNSTSTIIADYGYRAEIVVTGLARSQGDGVVVDVGSGNKELIMTGIVILAIVVAIWIQFLYRARRKRAILGRR
ncbi:MAG: hypothetical protein ABSD49_09295 [Candidatus Bathyarchaeia archaeon]|jgi:hypothetical protein